MNKSWKVPEGAIKLARTPRRVALPAMPITGSAKHHSVVVPLLLSTGYHVATDVPRLQPFAQFRSSLSTSALIVNLAEPWRHDC